MRPWCALALICFAAACITPAPSSPPHSTSQFDLTDLRLRLVYELGEGVMAAARDTTLSDTARRAMIRGIVESRFDAEGMAARVFLGHFQRFPEHRKEFSDLLLKVMERRYLTPGNIAVLRKAKLELPRLEVSAGGLAAIADRASVHSILRTHEDIKIRYDLKRTKSGWRIADVSVFGISLIQSYQQQFSRVLRGTNASDTFAEVQALIHRATARRE